MSTVKTASLLPDNASVFELGLERAFSEQLYDIENPYPTLLKPLETGKATLPYVAQDKGVTEWQVAASEQEQRKIVLNAWQLRRFAGTPKGITMALDQLQYDARITPWHQMKPKGTPYALEIVAVKREQSEINKEAVQGLLSTIDDIKSERDLADVAVAHNSTLSFAVGGGSSRSYNINYLEAIAE